MLRRVVAPLVGCCLLLNILSAQLPLSLPAPHFDLTTAKIWKCNHSPDDSVLSLQDLHNNGHTHQLEIIHTTSSFNQSVTVDLLTPITSERELQSLGLTNCTLLTNMDTLIANELSGNWDHLQHHLELGNKIALPDMIQDVIRERESEHDHGRSMGSQRVLRRSVRDDDSLKLEDDKEMEEWFSHYHNLSSMYHWYLKLSESYPDRVRLNKTIGKSYHEREIIALHFTEKNENRDKPKIFIQCLLHSREWISGSVCMYLSHRLARPHPTDTAIQKLLREVEFVVVPVANPDGYYATWVQYPRYRLWRKNVQTLEGSTCAGVDLNRNFNSHWDQEAYSKSDDPCSELYRGPFAGSELEVQTLTSYIKSLGRVIGAIDFHSYHQKILYPPAFSGEGAGDLDRIQLAAQRMAETASDGGSHTYTPHKMFDLYSAAGTFADWLLDYRNDPAYPDSDDLVPLTVELRPHAGNVTSSYTGFLLPTSEILPTCHEMYSAFLTYSEFVLEESKKQNSHL